MKKVLAATLFILISLLIIIAVFNLAYFMLSFSFEQTTELMIKQQSGYYVNPKTYLFYSDMFPRITLCICSTISVISVFFLSEYLERKVKVL